MERVQKPPTIKAFLPLKETARALNKNHLYTNVNSLRTDSSVYLILASVYIFVITSTVFFFSIDATD